MMLVQQSHFRMLLKGRIENSNRINKIYFYNYSDGIIADLLGSNTELPTLRILDGAGSALTNGSNASTGPSTLINNLDMTRRV